MSFFNSDLVKKEMEEITELQEKIYDSVFKFPTMNNKEKLEHIEILEKLLNKQQILYTRLRLDFLMMLILGMSFQICVL